MRILLASPKMSNFEYEKKYVEEAFKTNWIAPLGPNVDLFEKNMKKYTQANYAVATSSGTAAIHLALKCLNIKPGDKIICSSLTFAATANPIIYEGAEPVFVDSELSTMNMCPFALQKAIDYLISKNKKPKAIIVAHLYGFIADMDAIMKISREYKIPVIEDAAEALGATYKLENGRKKMAGTMGDFGIYSFNGNKIITTSGGGMLVCKKQEHAERALKLATQAKENAPYYLHKEIGYNYRMSNVCAGIGIGQLKVINIHINLKTFLNGYYDRFLPSYLRIYDTLFNNQTPNYWLSIARVDRDISPQKIINHLAINGIEARRIWKPLHTQPVFKGCLFFKAGKVDVSKYIFRNYICLPSDINMEIKDINTVIKALEEI